MALQDCFKKAGKALAEKDKKAIELFVADGMDEVEAVIQQLGVIDGEIDSFAKDMADKDIALASLEKPSKELADTSDVGGEMLANRRQKGFSLADVRGAGNDTERLSMAVKSKLWERPDYQALVDSGVKPMVAHLVKQIYDTIPTKPKHKQDKYIYAFVEGVETAREAVNEFLLDNKAQLKLIDAAAMEAARYSSSGPIDIIKTMSIQARLDAKGVLFEKIFPEVNGARWGKKNEKGNDRAVAMGRGFIAKIQFDLNDFIKALKAVDEGFPAKQEAWQRSYIIAKDGDKFALRKKRSRRNIEVFETEELAKEKARELSQKTTKESFKEPETSPEMSKRIGDNLRNGRNISTKEMQDVFGFSKINFGNWMKGSGVAEERQAHINSAYDAFLDLSDLLGIPPKAISLNGMLSIAFGAQGKGKAAAHFVPGANEINLTRKTGAGSLAHEWAHALDHYFGVQADRAKNDSPYLSEAPYVPKDSKLRPEIAEAFNMIRTAMRSFERVRSPEEMETLRQESIERSRKYLDSWLRNVESGAKGKETETFKAILENLRSGKVGEYVRLGKSQDYVVEEVNKLREEYKKITGRYIDKDRTLSINTNARSLAVALDESEFTKTHKPQISERSNYLRNASLLDGDKSKKYWSTNLEMFARAFEIYVVNKLERKEARNDYLTSRWKVDLDSIYRGEALMRYPQDKEMDAIYEAFESLVQAIKYRDTDKGVELYSKKEKTTREAHTADSLRESMNAVFPGLIKVLEKSGVAEIITSDQVPPDIGMAKMSVNDIPGTPAWRSAKAKGLDMSKPARFRRARTMGFKTDQPWYHGTSDDIKAFSLDKTQTRDSGFIGRGVYLTSSPDIAKYYANMATPTERQDDGTFAEPNLIPVFISANNPKRYTLAEKQSMAKKVRENPAYAQELTSDLMSQGFDSAEVVDVNGDVVERVVFNPSQIRSVNAAFDPDYKEKPDLLYSIDQKPLAYVKGGKVTFIADNIPKNQDVRGLMLHEIGVHLHQLGKDSKEFQNIISRFKRLKGKDAKVRAAYRSVPKDTKESLIDEEAIGYYVQQNPELTISKKVIAWFKDQLRKLVEMMKASPSNPIAIFANTLTPNDYLYMATKAMDPRANKTDPTNNVKYMVAYHGTPHKFDKFSLKAIGTGEGAQAYGWGLYFAGKREIAEFYRKKLRRRKDNGPRYTSDFLDDGLITENEYAFLADTEFDEYGIGASEDYLDAVKEISPSKLDEARRIIGALERGMFDANLYQVDIPEDGALLDWDKPLSAQPEEVKNKLQPVLDYLLSRPITDQNKEKINNGTVTGEQIYRFLTGEMAIEHNAPIFQDAPRLASEALNLDGIPGLRYLDGVSRNKSLKDIKREFLAELPQSADFDEVMELIGTGIFSAKNERILKALKSDDWLGFDYPAQAISTALSKDVQDFDPSPELLDAIADAKEDGTYNYVIWDEDVVTIEAVNDELVQAKEQDKETQEAAEEEVKFAKGQSSIPLVPGDWESPAMTKWDNIVHTLQNKHIDTLRIQEAIEESGKQITDAANPYLNEELFHARSAKRIKDYVDFELRPLLKEMNARNVEMQAFEHFLWARHAKERNAQIAKVNPKMPDGGSGLMDQQADDYVNGRDVLDSNGNVIIKATTAQQRRTMEKLARRIDRMNAQTQQHLVDYGLEKQETIDAWNTVYQHYVPLMRDVEESQGTGVGMSVPGPFGKRAMGSGKEVVNVLANLAMQRERAIVRGEKNKVAQSLFGLALHAPNKKFWLPVMPSKITPAQRQDFINDLVNMGLDPTDAQNLVDEPKQRFINPQTGLVDERVNVAERYKDNVIGVRWNGDDLFLFFDKKDPRGTRLVRSMKNLDGTQLGYILGNTIKVTRYFAAINTQYNPIFGVVNFLRDVQTMALNLTSTPISGRQAEVTKHTISALSGIIRDLRAHRSGKVPSSAWAQLWEEFQKEGGTTGYRDMFVTSEERTKQLESELKSLNRSAFLKPGSAIFGMLSDYNEAMENATRLAVYKTAKEQGLSNAKAASLAKNITVNFNRKGLIGTQAGALFAFFNASMQGTARMYETLKSPTGKKIIAGGIMLGVVQALMSASAGWDDEEPPQFVRERSLIIPAPWSKGEKYVQIPMPLGFHVLPNIGRVFTEWALGGFRDTHKRIADFTAIFADTFNPIGNAGWSMQTVLPTVFDPLAALAENKDWTGKPIFREDFSKTDPTPGFSRTKDTATFLSKWITKELNMLTGGTEYTPGVISWTPDALDYVGGQVTGGVGREIMKASQWVESIYTGEELPVYKIPLGGRFYGTTTGQASEANRFYTYIRKLNIHENEIEGRRKDKLPVAEYLREHPEARLYQLGNSTESMVRKLRQRKRILVERGASAEQVKRIEEQISLRMKRFNDRVKMVMEK